MKYGPGKDRFAGASPARQIIGHIHGRDVLPLSALLLTPFPPLPRQHSLVFVAAAAADRTVHSSSNNNKNKRAFKQQQQQRKQEYAGVADEEMKPLLLEPAASTAASGAILMLQCRKFSEGMHALPAHPITDEQNRIRQRLAFLQLR